MDFIGRINTLIWAWLQCVRSVKRISIFFPFFLFALLQLFLLALLTWFYLPPFSHLLIPLTERFFGEQALHFPQHLLALPHIYAQMNRWILNPLASWLIIGTATALFASFYRGILLRIGEGLKAALRRWHFLFLIGLVEFGIIVAIQELLKNGGSRWMPWSHQSPRLFGLAIFLLQIALITPFAYTTAQVVLGGRGIGGALRGSFVMARRNFGVTYLIIFIPSCVSFVVSNVLLPPLIPLVVTRLNPTMVLPLISASIVMAMLVNFVIVGPLTALYLGFSATGDEASRRASEVPRPGSKIQE